jgi:hypothetical protein
LKNYDLINSLYDVNGYTKTSCLPDLSLKYFFNLVDNLIDIVIIWTKNKGSFVYLYTNKKIFRIDFFGVDHENLYACMLTPYLSNQFLVKQTFKHHDIIKWIY